MFMQKWESYLIRLYTYCTQTWTLGTLSCLFLIFIAIFVY